MDGGGTVVDIAVETPSPLTSLLLEVVIVLLVATALLVAAALGGAGACEGATVAGRAVGSSRRHKCRWCLRVSSGLRCLLRCHPAHLPSPLLVRRPPSDF